MPTTTPGNGGERRTAPPRPTPTPPGVTGATGATGDDTLRGVSGGNLVGSWGSGLDEAQGVAPGDGSLLDRDVPIGSDLARASGHAVSPEDMATGAGTTTSAGPHSLGGTSGSERTSAGTAAGTRSSRDGGNVLSTRDDGRE